MSDLDPHPPICTCAACAAPPPEEAPASGESTAGPAAAKPVYSLSQVINALRTSDGTWGSIAWGGAAVTYSIGTGAPSPGSADYRSEYSGYTAMTQAMEAAAVEAFELWDDLIAIDLVAVENDPSAQITLNYSSATSGGGTYASYSYSASTDGRADWGIVDSAVWMADDWWTHNDDADLYDGSYGIMTYLHEIGHALGLSHPANYSAGATYATDATHYQDTRAYTLMSYFNAGDNGSGADHAGAAGTRYGATPLLHDIAAIQAAYGADMTTRTDNTTYGFNSTADRAAFDFSQNSEPVVAIWDAGGIDAIDVSGWNTDQVIDLTEGALSDVGGLTQNLAIAYGAVIEKALGGGGNDRITGNASANVLTGNGGNDTLTGGDGNDVLFGGAGSDTLDGGGGTDWVRYAASSAGVAVDLAAGTGTGGDAAGDVVTGIEHVSGSAYGDTLTGDAATSNQLFGLGGNDVIIGAGGHDFLLGHDGDDWIQGGTGRDVIRGGAGADTLDGGSEQDWVQYNDATSGVALDLATGGTIGDAAGDVFIDVENVLGSNHDDVITGDAARNQIRGGAGADTIDGAGGPDVLYGQSGDDTITGGTGADTIEGGTGADSIDGGDGLDWAWYRGAEAGVAVSLATGLGTAGDAAGDILSAIEWLWGSDHDDTLTGDSSANILRGGSGDDTITGGAGNDVLAGNAGADLFVFALNDGIDRIHGFEIGIDLLDVSDVVTNFGQLSVSSFRGEAAIAYDTGDVILLTGIADTAVTADMFVFG